MNRLKTEINGSGYPFELDDLRWIEAGIADAFKAVFAAYGEKFIISGCELTFNEISGLYECTTGYIYFDGEILYCPGGIAQSDETHTPVFDLEVVYDLDGAEMFGNSEVYTTYEIRRAKFYSVAPENTVGKLIAITAKRMHHVIAELIASKKEAWIYPTLTNWETEDTEDLSRVKYRKDLFGNVELQGQAHRTNSGALFTLPGAYKPPRPLYFITIWPILGDDHLTATIRIGTDGVVYCVETYRNWVNLDGIKF